MRTPDNDDSGQEASASLADGYGTVVSDGDDTGDDTDFGEGAGDANPALAADEGADPVADEGGTEVFLDPSDSYTDTDLDLNSDGLVDGADFDEAVHGFFDFSSVDEPADASAEASDTEEIVDPYAPEEGDLGVDDIFGGLFGGLPDG